MYTRVRIAANANTIANFILYAFLQNFAPYIRFFRADGSNTCASKHLNNHFYFSDRLLHSPFCNFSEAYSNNGFFMHKSKQNHSYVQHGSTYKQKTDAAHFEIICIVIASCLRIRKLNWHSDLRHIVFELIFYLLFSMFRKIFSSFSK